MLFLNQTGNCQYFPPLGSWDLLKQGLQPLGGLVVRGRGAVPPHCGIYAFHQLWHPGQAHDQVSQQVLGEPRRLLGYVHVSQAE